jgi:hypothetical protein
MEFPLQPIAGLLTPYLTDRACPGSLLTRNQQDAFGQRLVGLSSFILLYEVLDPPGDD